MSSSFSTRSPFSLTSRFRWRLVTIRLGVRGVTGVKGMYGLYGVGSPVRGPPIGFSGRSKTVVLVAGALCRGNASRKGNEEDPWLLTVDNANGAGTGALLPPEILS